MARLLIFLGIALIAAGVLWHLGLLKWVGRLPGDIRIERENFKFYFPFSTCILLSLSWMAISAVLRFFQK